MNKFHLAMQVFNSSASCHINIYSTPTCLLGLLTWIWHSQADHQWLYFPPPQRWSCWLSFLRGRAAWRPQAHWHCSCHPQDGKVAGSMAPRRGSWQHLSLPGPVKGQGWGAWSLSALIEGQPSISHRQSWRSAKANGWVLCARPMEWLILTPKEWILVTFVCTAPYSWWPHDDAYSSQNSRHLPDAG